MRRLATTERQKKLVVSGQLPRHGVLSPVRCYFPNQDQGCTFAPEKKKCSSQRVSARVSFTSTASSCHDMTRPSPLMPLCGLPPTVVPSKDTTTAITHHAISTLPLRRLFPRTYYVYTSPPLNRAAFFMTRLGLRGGSKHIIYRSSSNSSGSICTSGTTT